MKGKHIVIGVTGSVAAYKAAELTSQLKQSDTDIYVVMTRNSLEFIGPVTFRSLTGNPVFCDMFSKEDPHSHIRLAEWMDILVIAPATANIIGKISHGIADDLLTTLVLATHKPIIIAPAMNEKIYLNKAVQDNIKILKGRGHHIIGPETGFLACGYTGKGRLAEVEMIIKEIRKVLK